MDNDSKLPKLCRWYYYAQGQGVLTKRNIHEASDIEPKTPDRASCAVSCRCGLLCAMVAIQCMIAGGRTTTDECRGMFPSLAMQKDPGYDASRETRRTTNKGRAECWRIGGQGLVRPNSDFDASAHLSFSGVTMMFT
jgi:hypothetical protein